MEQVYIFDFENRIKVGYSTNVKKRLRTIELSSGQKAKNVFSVEAGKNVESLAHAWLPNRLEGEFFACPYADAVELIQKIVSGEITSPPFVPKKVKEAKTVNNELVALRIKETCKKKSILISTLLTDCKIRKSLIYDMEKRDKTPSSAVLEQIADYLDCSVDYLLGRTDNPEVNR